MEPLDDVDVAVLLESMAILHAQLLGVLYSLIDRHLQDMLLDRYSGLRERIRFPTRRLCGSIATSWPERVLLNPF
ncbi:MAG: hypothetical protein OXC02_07825 [Rhodobacteraceae bacterium]|nr:hypothetical protein [Paracoccaceae bacterium]